MSLTWSAMLGGGSGFQPVALRTSAATKSTVNT